MWAIQKKLVKHENSYRHLYYNILLLVKSRYKFSDVTECKPIHKCHFRFLIDLYFLCQETLTPSVHEQGYKASFFRSSWPYYDTWHWTSTGYQLGHFVHPESHVLLQYITWRMKKGRQWSINMLLKQNNMLFVTD